MLTQPPKFGGQDRSQASRMEKPADLTDDDLAYFNAIPGLKQAFTDEALLDLWVREQQSAWLRNAGDGDAFKVDELRARVLKRVEKIKERELANTVRSLRRDLLSYSVFVVLFSIILTAFLFSDTYPYVTKVKAQLLKDREGATFDEVLTQDDAWDWMINWLAPAIFSPWSPPFDNNDQRNVLIGAIQLQQLRVSKHEKCPTPAMYVPFIQECYPGLGAESTDRYGAYLQFVPTSVGGVAGLLQSEAFVQNLRSDLNASEAARQLGILRDTGWVDLQTRVIRILLTYYNPTVDLFCSVTLLLNYLETGGIETKSFFRTIDPQRHVAVLTNSAVVRYFPPSALDYALLGVEAVFWILVLLRLIVEIRFVCSFGLYLWVASIWHVIDFFNCVCLCTIGFMRLLLLSIISSLNFTPEPDEFADFHTATGWVQTIQTLLSISCLLTYGKLIKYLQISPQISWVTRSFTEAQQHMLGQLVALVAIFHGYATALHFAFGTSIEEYSTVIQAWNQMFTIMIGEFDYTSFVETGSVVGPYIFMSFMSLYILIIINMIVAIMESAFNEVKKRNEADKAREPALLAARHIIYRFIAWLKASFVARQLRKVTEHSRRLAQAREQKNNILKLMRRRGIGSMGFIEHETSEVKLRKLTLRQRAERQLAAEQEAERHAARVRARGGELGGAASEQVAKSRISSVIASRDLNIAAGLDADAHLEGSGNAMAIRRNRRQQQEQETFLTLEEKFGLIAENAEGANQLVGFRQVARQLTKHCMDCKMRWALGLPDDMSTPRVAMRLLEFADMPMSRRLSEQQISNVMQIGRSLYDRAVSRSEKAANLKALDLRAGGFLSEWHAQMQELDSSLLDLGAELGEKQLAMDTKISALTSALNHLAVNSVLTDPHKLAKRQHASVAPNEENGLSSARRAAQRHAAKPNAPGAGMPGAASCALTKGLTSRSFMINQTTSSKVDKDALDALVASNKAIAAASAASLVLAQDALQTLPDGSAERTCGGVTVQLPPRPRVPKPRPSDRPADVVGDALIKPYELPNRPHMRSVTIETSSASNARRGDLPGGAHVVEVSEEETLGLPEERTKVHAQASLGVGRQQAALNRMDALVSSAYKVSTMKTHYDLALDDARPAHRSKPSLRAELSLPHTRAKTCRGGTNNGEVAVQWHHPSTNDEAEQDAHFKSNAELAAEGVDNIDGSEVGAQRNGTNAPHTKGVDAESKEEGNEELPWRTTRSSVKELEESHPVTRTLATFEPRARLASAIALPPPAPEAAESAESLASAVEAATQAVSAAWRSRVAEGGEDDDEEALRQAAQAAADKAAAAQALRAKERVERARSSRSIEVVPPQGLSTATKAESSSDQKTKLPFDSVPKPVQRPSFERKKGKLIEPPTVPRPSGVDPNDDGDHVRVTSADIKGSSSAVPQAPEDAADDVSRRVEAMQWLAAKEVCQLPPALSLVAVCTEEGASHSRRRTMKWPP